MRLNAPVSEVDMGDLLGLLRDQHGALRLRLNRCAEASGPELLRELDGLRKQLEAHLPHKQQLYRAIEATSKARNDAASRNLASIFERNMEVQAAAVNGFFKELGTLAGNPEQLAKRTRTVLDTLRTRLDTEERAVFALYEKLTHPKERSKEPRP